MISLQPKSILVVLVAVLLVAPTPPLNAATREVEPLAAVQPAGDARVSRVTFDVDDCQAVGPTVALLPAIAAIVLPKLVEKGLDFLSGLLSKQLEDKNGSSTARGAEELFCPGRENLRINGITFERVALSEPDDFGRSQETRELLAEFDVIESMDRTAFRVELRSLDYQETSALKRGKGRKDILITGIFESPFADVRSEEHAQAAIFGVFQLALQRVKIGSKMDFGEHPIQSQWIALPKPAAEDKDKDEDEDEDEWEDEDVGELSASQPTLFTAPFSVLINVTETEQSGDLLVKAVEAFAETEDDLKDLLTEIIRNALGVSNDDG
ncbi:MAG: hypothetical protein WBG64_16425 [Thermoanaerobaculia bacterium]